MKALLDRWNRWGTARLDPGLSRDVTAHIDPFLDSPEVVALIGPRRAGKSTVLYQLMDRLEARGVPPTAMLHLNLEDPSLAFDELDRERGLALLDQVYETWRREVHPKGRGWLFLDEVQRVPGWERWVRARKETEPIKVFVTGSSSALLSRDLGTLLTGRHISFEVLPLGLTEILRFRGLDADTCDPATLHAALLDLLRWGGFPEVVLATDDRRREALLRQYFEDLLYKDVALRHQVRDLPMLRALAVHLLASTASLVSFQRLAGIFGVSVELVRTYCGYLSDAWLIELVPYYTLKTAERLRHPQKVHALDAGLRNAVVLSAGADWGRLAESAVYGALRRLTAHGLHYWQGRGEVDLIVRRADRVEAAIQVLWEGWDRVEVHAREAAALHEAAERFPGARLVVVSGAGEAGTMGLGRVLMAPGTLLLGD